MAGYPGHLQSLADVLVWKSVPWRLQALCRYVYHSTWWFNDGQTKHDRNIQKKAKSVCRECPVRWQCLARYMDQPYGIYGGFDEKERAALLPSIPIRLRGRPAFLKQWIEGDTAPNEGSTVTIRSSVG